jgi:hypothetical protein
MFAGAQIVRSRARFTLAAAAAAAAAQGSDRSRNNRAIGRPRAGGPPATTTGGDHRSTVMTAVVDVSMSWPDENERTVPTVTIGLQPGRPPAYRAAAGDETFEVGGRGQDQ